MATAADFTVQHRGAAFYHFRANNARQDAEDLKNCITESVPPSRPPSDKVEHVAAACFNFLRWPTDRRKALELVR